MVLHLVPILVGGAVYGAVTQEESGDYSADGGGRVIDAYQIYEQINSGPGTGSLVQGQQAAGTLQGTFADRISQIEALSRKMDRAWQGDAADAASAGAHPLKQWLEDSRGKLRESDRYLGEQTDAFTTVTSRVQPVPKTPPESDFVNDIKPWETDTDKAIRDYNAKAQGNVDAFNAYYQVSSSNGQAMPVYNALDGEVGAVEVGKDEVDEDTGAENSGRDYGSVGPAPSGMPNGPAGGGYSTSPTPGSQPGVGGGSPSGEGGSGSGGGSAGGYSGSGGGGGSSTLPGGSGSGGYTYRPGQWDDGTAASGFTPPKPNAADLGSGGFGPGGTGGIGGAGSGGSGPGAGGVGGVGAVGAGAVGGFGPGSGGAVPGAGASTGAAGPGAAAGAAGRVAMGGAAAAGAAGGGRGMGGMPMGAMGGGRGGQGSDDEEHQTKFLLEEDGDSLFGSDELTAPPVIGE